MRIHLLRHGETEYNKEARYQGRKDIPLSEEGKKKLFCSKENPDQVYVSGLSRTRQTAEIIYPGAEYIAVPDLDEMDLGKFEGKQFSDLRRNKDYRRWLDSGGSTRCPGGEDKAEFSERICKAMQMILEKECDAGTENVYIVAHGGTVMAAMERYCIDCPGDYYGWQTGNGEGYLLDCSWEGAQMRWHVVRRLSYDKNAGRVHLYYGEGRGKTSIAMGTALRALQQGYDVTVLQLCKNAGSGETAQLEKLGAKIYYGKETPGFVSAMNAEEKAKLKETQTKQLEYIMTGYTAPISYPGRLLILDEVCAALDVEVLDEKILWNSILRKPSDLEIILTGRYPKEWLLQAADYVTELKAVRHPYHDGLSARKGIEY
ncbi:MAG: cob(I)yrinic acid a,c-diamide adenosyltransferase [Lachnospiraceae bacterium]|nr:cob(I)yrinic acid a,c-diamide adenosyltransferase [Lachnospiraceae bacterium]